MTPDQLAKSGSEHAHQRALFAAVNAYTFKHRDSSISEKLRWLHAIPNGGERHAAVAGKMKAEGAKPGVFDVFLPVPRVTERMYSFNTLFAGAYGVIGTQGFIHEAYHGLYIEMKEPGRRNHKDGGLSAEQLEFKLFVGVQGYAHCVCYTWEEAYAAIMKYLGVEA